MGKISRGLGMGEKKRQPRPKEIRDERSNAMEKTRVNTLKAKVIAVSFQMTNRVVKIFH